MQAALRQARPHAGGSDVGGRGLGARVGGDVAHGSVAADVAAASSVDLDLWRDDMGVPERAFDELVVRQPSFVEGVGKLFTDDRLPAWRDWLAWQVIRSRDG